MCYRLMSTRYDLLHRKRYIKINSVKSALKQFQQQVRCCSAVVFSGSVEADSGERGNRVTCSLWAGHVKDELQYKQGQGYSLLMLSCPAW